MEGAGFMNKHDVVCMINQKIRKKQKDCCYKISFKNCENDSKCLSIKGSSIQIGSIETICPRGHILARGIETY